MAEAGLKIRARTPTDADWVHARLVEEGGVELIVVRDQRRCFDGLSALAMSAGDDTYTFTAGTGVSPLCPGQR